MKCKRCGIKEANETTKVCEDCYEEMHPGVHKRMEEEEKLWKIISKQASK